MSETELIEKAQNGDRNAFRRLVEDWQGFVYSIAYRFVGNSDDSEDLVQETFIKLWKNLKNYKPQSPMKPWLGRIVTNLCLDFLKSAKTRQARHNTQLTDVLLHSTSGTPEQEFDKAELQNVIRRLALELTPRQQSVFVLRDLEEMEVDEVTEILQITKDVVKSNLYYARIKIKEGLQAYYGNKLVRY
jgi:RNA polymerase sigma-70 factor (ECF subfamily)